MTHPRQSRPDSGRGFTAKVRNTLKVVHSSLGRRAGTCFKTVPTICSRFAPGARQKSTLQQMCATQSQRSHLLPFLGLGASRHLATRHSGAFRRSPLLLARRPRRLSCLVRVQGFRFRAWSSWFKVWGEGLWFMVYGFGFMVWGLGLRVEGLGLGDLSLVFLVQG